MRGKAERGEKKEMKMGIRKGKSKGGRKDEKGTGEEENGKKRRIELKED